MSAAVLAGGWSRRMGRDKAWLPAPPFQSLLERQLSVLQEMGPCECLVSCREGQVLPPHPGAQRVHDDGSKGPLGGLVQILRAMRAPRVVVLAVDVARIDAGTLRRIMGASADDDSRGIVPRTAAWVQPLAAVWPRTMLPAAEAQLSLGVDYSMQALVRRGVAEGILDWFDVPPGDEGHFENWNRPADVRPTGWARRT